MISLPSVLWVVSRLPRSGKVIHVEMQYLQFPAAAANAVILLAAVLMIIYGLTRVVDIRKEL
ncbi:MAG: hypothetical protein Ct9H300mP13_3530 [Gammaproteobacteria bacterium]|nr:MAG: hypothetical protein Ct9H300mP13_3530 [Gammaproteobacteria bacterium]